MGLANIVFDELESGTIRKSIGDQGLRVFKNSFQESQKDKHGNIFSWVWNGAKRLVGFLIAKAGQLLSFSLSALWGWFTSTLQYLWNFDWNMSDKSIDEQIKSSWDAIGSLLGGTVGNLFGQLGCGLVPAATIFAFNEPLGAYVLKEVGEEIAEEFLGNLGGLVRATLTSATQSAILFTYKNARKFIKSNNALMKAIFGDKAEAIQKSWGKEGSEPWSFALQLENKIESIPNTFIRNLVEEFAEEAWEGCVEAGYVVANSVDSYMASEKLKQATMPVLGKERVVEITPNRENKDQRIVLAGGEQALKPLIVQTLTNYQLMEDKDVGVVYGFKPDTTVSTTFKPQLELKFLEKKKPGVKYQKLTEGQISIRLMNETSQTITKDKVEVFANKVKSKFGGDSPFIWNKGKIMVSYNDWEKGYRLKLFVGTKTSAKRIIEQVLDIQGHSPDWEKMNVIVNEELDTKYSSKPDKITVLGKVEEQPVRRPVVDVVFQYAQLFIHGRVDPVTLYDRTGRWQNVIAKDDAKNE